MGAMTKYAEISTMKIGIPIHTYGRRKWINKWAISESLQASVPKQGEMGGHWSENNLLFQWWIQGRGPGGPPPPPPHPFRRNTKSKSNGYPVTKFIFGFCVRLGNSNSQTDFSNNFPFVYRPYFFVFFDVQQRGEVVTSRCHGSKFLDDNKPKNSLKCLKLH